MQQLVGRLLGGVKPRRILLCDRYVRGDDNLTALQLLVTTLREVSPGVQLAVWTEEDPSFQKIQAVTGVPARSYRDMFGRNGPHDRYMVVVPQGAQGFGWQMTNSPLHARADIPGGVPATPLRWKDLSAARITADELEPALRQWLLGGGQ